MNLSRRGLCSILEWSFTIRDRRRSRHQFIEEFWKEAEERMAEGDITGEIFVQLGVLISKRAYV